MTASWSIANGKVMAAGTPDELRAQTGEDNLEDAFVKAIGIGRGTARMNATLCTVMRKELPTCSATAAPWRLRC